MGTCLAAGTDRPGGRDARVLVTVEAFGERGIPYGREFAGPQSDADRLGAATLLACDIVVGLAPGTRTLRLSLWAVGGRGGLAGRVRLFDGLIVRPAILYEPAVTSSPGCLRPGPVSC